MVYDSLRFPKGCACCKAIQRQNSRWSNDRFEDDLREVDYPSVGADVVGLFIYPVLLSTHSLNDGNLESKTVEGAAAD